MNVSHGYYVALSYRVAYSGFSYTCKVNVYHDIINTVYIHHLHTNETVSQYMMKQMLTAVSVSPDNSHDTEPSFSSEESHLIAFNDLIHQFYPIQDSFCLVPSYLTSPVSKSVYFVTFSHCVIQYVQERKMRYMLLHLLGSEGM